MKSLKRDVLTLVYEIQEFVPGVLIVFKGADHRTGDRYRILFLDAPHNHAQVLRFNHDGDAARVNLLIDRVRNLRRQSLLNLKPPGIHIHQPRDLAQSDYAPVWDIPHMALPEEREQVMLAQAEQFD